MHRTALRRKRSLASQNTNFAAHFAMRYRLSRTLICPFVRLLVCRQNTIFSKTKKFRAVISIDDLSYRKSDMGFSKKPLLDPKIQNSLSCYWSILCSEGDVPNSALSFHVMAMFCLFGHLYVT